ncbi:hypothetical protein N658DRAFT_499981 [Parathielavia hyrcaniae]|uniref:Uncharacterized protein n=1 Tax=Parathielavia hyrcaniae TaxID=113614 RepID=A0AAN6PYP8_9PEZI|nr:hypothetical protein N658DRAFT_499981 [Parathielavia hyrcaniae]
MTPSCAYAGRICCEVQEQREESGDAKADEYEDGQEREEATNCSGLGNQVVVDPCQGQSGLHVEPPQQ